MSHTVHTPGPIYLAAKNDGLFLIDQHPRPTVERLRKSASTVLKEERSTADANATFDVFLSHSFEDWDMDCWAKPTRYRNVASDPAVHLDLLVSRLTIAILLPSMSSVRYGLAVELSDCEIKT
jgi:hypothetical protein